MQMIKQIMYLSWPNLLTLLDELFRKVKNLKYVYLKVLLQLLEFLVKHERNTLFFLRFQELLANNNSYQGSQQKMIQKTLKRQTKLNQEVMRNLMKDEVSSEMYNSWLHSRRSNNLEKLHFIIGHGIIRKELR